MKTTAALFLLALSGANGYSIPSTKSAKSINVGDTSALGRRQALGSILGGSLAFLAVPAVNALDMDAFENSQVSK